MSRFKLFPRNLTARADTLVRGNPVTTRPESGVENCYPGLEFDQRNLDSAFFAGLRFEMHHSAGVVLREFAADSAAARYFSPEDITQGVFLVYLQGMFASRVEGVPVSKRTLRFTPPAGLESWRIIRDLEVGEVAVVLCNRETLSRVANGAVNAETVNGWLDKREPLRDEPGVGRFIMLFGERARYLDADGVIRGDLLAPGQLTRSLCSPWQYDFADCGCFYWASNKPDLVSSEAQPHQVLNFQRKDRSPEGDRATTADDWVLKHDYQWDSARVIVRHAGMLSHWESLPFVVRRKETDRYVPLRPHPPVQLLDRTTIIDRLTRLAPVEHALAVEYLYAYYSLGLAPARPPGLNPTGSLVYTAGDEVFQVAVDEMRHLRSVNEILIALGAPWQFDRADVIGEDFDNSGRAFERPFALRPLDPDQLNWFIDVEQASQNDPDQNTIDGMYTLILRSVQAGGEFSDDEKARVSGLLKVIIDEGMDHFARFSRAKAALAGIAPATYLKVTDEPALIADGDPDRILQDVVDAAYLVVLRSLDYVFQLGDGQKGAMMESARRAMYNMDDAARSLAARGHGALFDHRRFGLIAPAAEMIAGAGLANLAESRERRVGAAYAVGDPLRALLDPLSSADTGAHAELARRMADRLARMTQDFAAAAGNPEQ